MKHHRFGGTAKRYIMENTESQALRPSLGSSSSPPVSSGGSPQPPSRVGHSTHSRPPTPCPPRPSLLTCRPRLPRRAGVAGGGRVPSAASPQPRPLSPRSRRTARTRTATLEPRLLGSLRSRLSAALSPTPEQPLRRRPSRVGSTPGSALAVPLPSAASAGLELTPLTGTTSPPQAEAHTVFNTRAP